jgi:hypothetical protein
VLVVRKDRSCTRIKGRLALPPVHLMWAGGSARLRNKTYKECVFMAKKTYLRSKVKGAVFENIKRYCTCEDMGTCMHDGYKADSEMDSAECKMEKCPLLRYPKPVEAACCNGDCACCDHNEADDGALPATE